jgi:aryl-alcohol dehydrogenase-like predicted oxidoreductase
VSGSDLNVSRRAVLAGGVAAGVSLAVAPSLLAQDAAKSGALLTRTIPSSGEKIPMVGVGTNNYSPKDEAETAARRDVLRRMAEQGAKVIDTAPLYGQSEVVLGKLMADLGNRDKFFVATKTLPNVGPDQAQAVLEKSLADLKVKSVELIQIHNLAHVDALMPVLAEWKKAGKAKYIGVTTSVPSAHPQMIEAMNKHKMDFIQVDYSLGNRASAEKVLPLAADKGIAVLINVPFGGRRGSLFSQLGERQLPAWAAEIGAASWGQFFLKYVLAHPAVTAAIPGMTKVSHVDDNLAAARGKLPDAAMRRKMEEFWDSKPT